MPATLASISNPVYTTLSLNHPRDIRLVRIYESQDGTISCKLWTVNLDQVPEYVALSYTWGPSTNEEFNRGVSNKPTHPILCNNYPISVTENLYNFLRRVAEDTKLATMSLWIDIISINQQDDHERTEQVKMMADIYESAATVIVWLGEHDKDTETNFALMRWLAGLAKRKDQKLKDITPTRLTSPEARELLAPYQNICYWKSMVKFFQRRYFNRVWIIQEITLGRIIEVLCGQHRISWDDIAQVSRIFTVTSWARTIAPGGILAPVDEYPSYHQLPNIFEANRRTVAHSKNEALLYLLIRARRSMAFDPRDKVYALIGIAREGIQGKARLNPVYGDRSVARTYTLTAIQVLEDSDDLLLLAYAEGQDFRMIESLPSWVPDWSCPRIVGLGVTGYTRFNASIGLARSLHIDETNCRLTVKGMKLDNIIQAAETKEEILTGNLFPRLVDLLSAIPQPYPTKKEAKQSRSEVLWRSLITDTAGEDRVRPASSAYGHAFSAWIRPKLDKTKHALSSTSFSAVYEVFDHDLPLNDGEPHLSPTTNTTEAEAYETVFAHSLHLRPFLTRNGYFGIGSQSLRENDSIWIIAGLRVPLILRQQMHGFEVVGGAYVHGFMSGEALELGYPFEDIVLV